MGQSSGVDVDVSVIRAAAQRFDTVGQAVARIARLPLRFDGFTAGRAHAGDGASIRRALDGLSIDLMSWSRATAEISIGLRCGADRYADAEAGAAARLG